MQPTMELEVSVDFVEEIRLRTWARENYVEPSNRDLNWHPVVLDEMAARDRELTQGDQL